MRREDDMKNWYLTFASLNRQTQRAGDSVEWPESVVEKGQGSALWWVRKEVVVEKRGGGGDEIEKVQPGSGLQTGWKVAEDPSIYRYLPRSKGKERVSICPFTASKH